MEDAVCRFAGLCWTLAAPPCAYVPQPALAPAVVSPAIAFRLVSWRCVTRGAHGRLQSVDRRRRACAFSRSENGVQVASQKRRPHRRRPSHSTLPLYHILYVSEHQLTLCVCVTCVCTLSRKFEQTPYCIKCCYRSCSCCDRCVYCIQW